MTWFDWAKEHLSKMKAEGESPLNQALALAHKEAERLKRDCIGTEHLLLGLIKLGSGIAFNILIKLGLNLENVRVEVEKQAGIRSGENLPVFIPYTPRVKKVLETAKKEAKALGHKYVGTEHLLLGESESPAAQVFKHFKVDVEKTRKEILNEITPIIPPPEDGQKGKN